MKAWDSRYVVYANALGMSPRQARRADRVRWPGGRMCGFQLFISSGAQLFVDEVLRPEASKATPTWSLTLGIGTDPRWDSFLMQHRRRIALHANLVKDDVGPTQQG